MELSGQTTSNVDEEERERSCLMCGDKFLSKAPQFRRCGQCSVRVKTWITANEDTWEESCGLAMGHSGANVYNEPNEHVMRSNSHVLFNTSGGSVR